MMPKCSNCSKLGRYPGKPEHLMCKETEERVQAQQFCYDYNPRNMAAFREEALKDDIASASLLDADRKEEEGNIKSARIIRIIHVTRRSYPYFLRV